MRCVTSSWHLIHLFKNAAACIEKDMQAGLLDMELSPCQAQALDVIDSHGASMSAMSKALCCHKSNITQIVDSLVSRNLVERVVSEKDRRICTLTLTPKGREVLIVIRRSLLAQSKICFEVLSHEECEQLQRLLDRLVAAWQKRA